MRGADSWAGTIKSGGKTRRAAKMVVLNVDHPDIEHFIWCKAKEEEKALALRDAGFDMSIDGEGFTSIQYQNANNSVRVTDDFMEAVEADEDWDLLARTGGETTQDAGRARADEPDLRRRLALPPIPAFSTTTSSIVGTPARSRAGSTPPTPAASTCTSTTRPATWPRST